MKQEIADIRSAFGEDNKIPAKVESNLKKIEKAYDDLTEKLTKSEAMIDKKEADIDDLYKESKKRQTKAQELEREVETLKEDKEKILADTKHEDYDELVKYKEANEVKLAAVKQETRKQFIERHETLKTHADYAKAKLVYKLPEEKDGKLDWTKISDDDIVFNAEKLKEQEGYGLFGGSKPKVSVNTEGGATTPTKPFNPYENQFPK